MFIPLDYSTGVHVYKNQKRK